MSSHCISVFSTSNHNKRTKGANNALLYIRSFLHQTTTWSYRLPTVLRCISVLFYIKPQPFNSTGSLLQVVYPFFSTSNHNGLENLVYREFVVYPFFSTSNHNPIGCVDNMFGLYIRSFLHQTTTQGRCNITVVCCISVLFYIKPQPIIEYAASGKGCISVLFYIKPQPLRLTRHRLFVVYPFFSTSNHNIGSAFCSNSMVVYPFFSTSNHNFRPLVNHCGELYIRSFLHQTTTKWCIRNNELKLYIRSFLHQTTTSKESSESEISCISVLFYIKPQQSKTNSMTL